ncbi:DUF4276 family protein [Cylindrospermopsis curvispora]|uniref:DUF4276 family protein n=1 Tax=Cylindrospermopsis curvispora TaxID=747548 RepID=UPI001F4409AF|nr:DUF4276 family protein [Cylindrospermopsis curvispora]
MRGINCEGQTEEDFIKEVLRPHFSQKGIAVYPSLIGKPGHKGGNFKIERLLNDVRNRIKGDTEAFCTTMFDYYGLPTSFPGKTTSTAGMTSEEKSNILCRELAQVIESQLGHSISKRFIPYVQMHEFEALLFSHPIMFAKSIDKPAIASELLTIRNSFASPEEINDGPMTAPSKRILTLIAEYQKPIMGVIGALEISLPVLRHECQLFNKWLCCLEQLSS